MTTELLISPGDLEQAETAQHRDAATLRRDAFATLDHRTRTRALPAAHAPIGHYMAVEDADGVARLIPLPDAVTHLGRAMGADVRFDDIHVSRRHAIVVRVGGHVRVLDDRSSAGTFVNGRRVLATDVLEGDVIRLGPITLTYVRVR